MLTTEQRFWSKVVRTDDCWQWIGQLSANGYGHFRLDGRHGKTVKAHRFAYEELVGAIPPGLQLDHLCRNRACVRPSHLEPVTQKVNILRGASPSATHAATTQCPAGHPYSGENLHIRPDGARRCKSCARERNAARRDQPCPVCSERLHASAIPRHLRRKHDGGAA